MHVNNSEGTKVYFASNKKQSDTHIDMNQIFSGWMNYAIVRWNISLCNLQCSVLFRVILDGSRYSRNGQSLKVLLLPCWWSLASVVIIVGYITIKIGVSSNPKIVTGSSMSDIWSTRPLVSNAVNPKMIYRETIRANMGKGKAWSLVKY